MKNINFKSIHLKNHSMLLPVSSFSVILNFNKIAIEIFISVIQSYVLQIIYATRYIIKITHQKVVYNYLGANSSYFIYHSREVVLFPLHIANVTIAKSCADAVRMSRRHVEKNLIPIRLGWHGVGDK